MRLDLPLHFKTAARSLVDNNDDDDNDDYEN